MSRVLVPPNPRSENTSTAADMMRLAALLVSQDFCSGPGGGVDVVTMIFTSG